jgi:hypothetical protein
MIQQCQLRKQPAAFKKNVRSLRNWHYNHGNIAISEEEQKYLAHERDLFSVVPKEKTPLRQLLERSKRFRIHPFWRKNKASELPIYDEDVIYTSDKRIERFITVVIVGTGTIMLIAPIWILQALHDPVHKLAVITAFIVVFLGMVSYATVAKPFETLAATAA